MTCPIQVDGRVLATTHRNLQDKGTLFLDEIGYMDLDAQALLLPGGVSALLLAGEALPDLRVPEPAPTQPEQ